MRALVHLAAGGDARGGRRRPALARDLADSADPAGRRGAAAALGRRGIVPPCGLLDRRFSMTPSLRCAPRRSTPSPPDDAAEPEIVERVVAALGEARTAAAPRRRSHGSATQRCRSSPPHSPAMARRRPPLVRAAAAAAADHGISRHRPGAGRSRPGRSYSPRSTRSMRPAAAGIVPPERPRRRVRRRGRARGPRVRCPDHPRRIRTGPLSRALEDETELARRLVVAVLALRHGDRVREAVRVVDRRGRPAPRPRRRGARRDHLP